jgi:hypothetical protein
MVGRSIQGAELAAFSSEIPGVEEKRRWALYDVERFAAAATVLGDYNLFTIPIGQGAPAKTLRETNMRQSGQLPARQGMEVWTVGVTIQPTLLITSETTVTIINNLAQAFYNLCYGASLTLRQAQKTDLEIAPLAFVPGGIGITSAGYATGNITAAAAAGGGALALNSGHPSRLACWELDPLPIVILPQRSFGVTLNFPVAQVLPAGVGLNIWCHLDGVLHRSA